MPPTRQLVGNKILCPACLVKEKKYGGEKKTRGVRPHFLRLLSTRGPLTLDCCKDLILGMDFRILGMDQKPAKLRGESNKGPKA